MDKINRRSFVKNSTLGMLLIGLHPDQLFSSNKSSEKVVKNTLIQHIKLQTSKSLFELKYFYQEQLGFDVVSSNSSSITFKAGDSLISFEKTTSDYENPWYHFAFNIPHNKLLKARDWMLKRTDLIPTPKNKRDKDYPNDVRHFKNWNAHSIFFWDPAGNLLEFIARHDLQNSVEGAFSSKDIINVSEIGLVVDDQHQMAQNINKETGLGVYPKGSSFWWAMGDENGLILCIPKRIWGENTDKPKRFAVHKTEVQIYGDNTSDIQFKGLPYKIYSGN